ncbi:hypothetical protein M0R72_00925 [Candidatus Pacearchaeota archaeon]|jgi:hypothetical protein|nr:hypothetical protein [Candidatus Pacearchaeota archaeon]
MGFNSTVIVCLDQLDSIEKDPGVGQSLALAVYRSSISNRPIDGPHGMMVVETHHADHLVPVIVGGNSGTVIPVYIGINPNEAREETNIRVLKEMARVLGYRVRFQ